MEGEWKVQTYSRTMTTLRTQTIHLGKMDVLGFLDPCKSQKNEEMEAAVLEQRTVSRNPDRRYEVSLP
jgi:hypothetical protein